MSENNQFYADNEKGEGGIEKNIDLSLAYEVTARFIPEQEWVTQNVIFFCHDCEKQVDTKKTEKGVKFVCAVCNGKNISFGTEKSVQKFFHLNEEGVQKR